MEFSDLPGIFASKNFASLSSFHSQKIEFSDLPEDIFYEIGDRLLGIDRYNFSLVNKATLNKVSPHESYKEQVYLESIRQVKIILDSYYSKLNLDNFEYKADKKYVKRYVRIYFRLPEKYGQIIIFVNDLPKKLKKDYEVSGHIKVGKKLIRFSGNLKEKFEI